VDKSLLLSVGYHVA